MFSVCSRGAKHATRPSTFISYLYGGAPPCSTAVLRRICCCVTRQSRQWSIAGGRDRLRCPLPPPRRQAGGPAGFISVRYHTAEMRYDGRTTCACACACIHNKTFCVTLDDLRDRALLDGLISNINIFFYPRQFAVLGLGFCCYVPCFSLDGASEAKV